MIALDWILTLVQRLRSAFLLIPAIITRMNWSTPVAVLVTLLSAGQVNAQAIHAPFAVNEYFDAAGWMGESSHGALLVKIDDSFTGKPRPGDDDGKCTRISWEPRSASWAGLYWQSPGGNWGSKPGRSVVGATKVVFWAAGQNGSEVVEFKAGGLRTMSAPYKDSFAATLGSVRLAIGWRRYEMNLRGQNLTSVIGAFAWTVHKAGNIGTVTFYLDGIRYE